MKKINSTAILLLITLLVVPVITYFFGTSLSPLQCEALKTVGIIAFAAIAFSFIVGEITKNNSQTDKLWSIVPIIYVWVVAGYGNFSPRLVLMAVLVSLWGIRLTANFALKGAYQWRFWTGEEDYRGNTCEADQSLTRLGNGQFSTSYSFVSINIHLFCFSHFPL